ncbi:histidine kinase|nr:ATP-binding protein [Pseudomonas sp. SbOxS1]NYU05521.1 histidine kinase [Pseudomonas sp. SbOxS1]
MLDPRTKNPAHTRRPHPLLTFTGSQIVVALFGMLVLTSMCLHQGGVYRWESTAGLLHSLTVLAAIIFVVLRSKQAEEALCRAQAQLAHVTRVTTLGELAASIAHEVNQPLAAIVSNGEACRNWLSRPQPDLVEAHQALQRIIASAHRASEITRHVWALSRKCDPLRQDESLNDIVSETLSLVRCELAHHKINPTIELGAFGGQVSADRVQLQQVIINLIINACQAMDAVAPTQRVLLIRTWVKDNEVVLEVTDQGPGIAAEDLPQLFTPFFTTKDNGLGMGLCICRSIIDFHNGRIWATSKAGHGSSFLFALPIRAAIQPLGNPS